MDNVIFVPGQFLSTLSLRRATTEIWDVIAVMTISIHALLAESDFFNAVQIVIVVIFLSTLSLRRATLDLHRNITGQRLFLSTLSLRRATIIWQAIRSVSRIFLSTLSLRRATF